MSKRKSNTTSGPAAKRAVKGRRLIQFEDVKSVEEQANEYLLGTVKFPLDALTKTWETGKNRRIDEKHVRELCKTFEEQHLQREDPKNHLLIECGGEEFGRMMDHVRQSAESMQGKWPSFHEWLSINSTHAEIMAGQHRVEALKLFLHRVSKINGPSAISDQAWWICRVYDRDRLPNCLRIQLRANRQGSTLPDSQGQIWMELATLAETDLSLFSGDNGSVKDEMLDMLSLSGPIDFPIRRLVTLWKNTKWKAAITEWCCTSLGRDTFNVSLWDEMARLRIDDYWFDTFNKVLKVISQIGREISNYISLADWNVLVGLKSPRSKTEIQSTFFPGASADVLSDLESKGSSSRRKNFLVSFDDSAYYAIYTAVSESPDLPFLNIQTFLRTSREHGRIFSQVIFHIGQWLNPSIYAVGDRENNKPQQWRNFLPAFEDSNGNESEESARSLQRHIFATFCNRLDELARGPGSSYLSDTDADEDDYLDRFSCPIWRDLLIEVYRIVGGRFQRSLAKFNTYDPYALPQQWLPPMERLRESIRCLPDIKSHPRLCQPSALDALMAFLRTWMVEHAEVVPGVVGHTDEPKTQVQEQDTQVGQHCCIIDTVDRDDTRPPSNTSPIEVSGTISGSAASEKYDGESVLDDLEYDSQARDKSRPNVIEDRDAQLDSTVPPTISKPSSIATFSLDDMLPSPADLEKLHVRHRQHRQHRPTIYSTEDTTNLEVAKPIQAQIDPLIPGQSQGKGSRRKLPDWRKRPAAVSMAPRM